MGYLCTYVPEEILYAAGILPVRITGSHEPQDVTEPYIYNMFCVYCRDCLAEGLLGKYSYLDGVVHAYGCMHIRQTYDSWLRHIPTPFSHFIYVPNHLQTHQAREQSLRSLQEFKSALETWLGTPISDKKLDKAIEVYNTNRHLMRQIYELRKEASPPISGSEALILSLSSMYMDKVEHNRFLEELLRMLPSRKRRPVEGPRLIFLSSESDSVELLDLVESLGSQIVIDDNCIGTRYFWNEVLPQEDRLRAINDRYMAKPFCPVKDMVERWRLPHIRKLAEDFRVKGAVYAKIKFCDSHEYDIPEIKATLEGMGVPLLVLECDIIIPEGQFRTRIEAFLEMLEVPV